MAGQKFTLSFDANLNVSQMKGALSAIQNELNGLKLPNNVTKSLTDGVSSLEKEIQNFQALASKDLSNKTNFSALERSAQKIDTLFSKLQIQAKDLLNTQDLSKLFPESITKNITKATDALGDYENKVKGINSEVKKTERLLKNWETKRDLAISDAASAQDKLDKLDLSRYNARLQEIFNRVKKPNGDITNPAEVKEALKLLDELIAKAEVYNNKVQNGLTTKGKPYADSTKANAQEELDALNQLKQAYSSEEAILTSNTKALESATKERDRAIKKVREYKAQLNQNKSEQSKTEATAIQELFNALSQLNGIDLSNYGRTVDEARRALKDYIALSQGNAVGETQKLDGAVNGQAQAFDDLTNAIRRARQEHEAFDNRARDVDALRTRIQYFFGLNNTINLVKRALRGAFNTIKELDKVMTETAVVTNFSVGDMWKQLPEYTKRANELGVTTKAAYEAATLYYQQGLTTKEVTELSVETLKMARIAGLEAAEATDRMTNALRGFNMELNETNAQRVDDVYSKLAAISASNVDEISTAMTKVASLAHNAGMEFETTAAFLAQIIETTRESAETAGTALKTVVARFGEVKKLVNEGQLKGSDEEGELINVNKVSEALRTAGINLNRYFLGEIGIDDIFIELAEKWDSLTSIQQRYIATQAAGSRQQSRFIALMSDYARTQELVGAAYKANGAAAEQFAKTQDSLESKLARLKNAWNEFLMGLANNAVVKGAVDLLTNLLNILNKVTDVFGEGVGSILKWVAALGTLRSAAKLFQKGGGFSALFNGTFGLGKVGIGDFLKNIGGKALGYGNYGAAASGLMGLKLGLVGLLKVLLPIAAVIGVIVAAYQAWLHFTPEGQLKLAEKHAKKMKEDAAEAEQTKKSYEELKDTLDDYNKSYEEASTLSERKSIIQQRNEAIRKAIEEDQKLASALEVTQDGLTGELVLTLNSNAVEEAAIHAAEEATKAAVEAYFAQADVALKQAAIIANKQKDTTQWVYAENSSNMVEQVFEGDHSDTTESLRQTYLAAAANQVSLAYGTIISSSAAEVSSEIGNALNTTLTQIYRDSLNNPDKEPAIFEISDVEVMLQGLSDGTLSAEALKALSAENFEFAVTDEMIEKDSDSLFEALGINTLSDSFKALEKILKLDEGQLKDLIKIRATYIKQMQEDNRKNLQARVNKANIQKDISKLNPEQVQRIETTAATAEEILDKQSYQMALQQMLEASNDDLIKFQQLIDSINTDEPISAFLKLREATRDTANPARELAGQILNANQELYNAGNLLQSFLISGEYEEILEDIEKILETDEALGAADIEELAKKSKSLNTLLKEDVVSAKALAKALTLVAKGEVGFEQLNTSVLKILENMYTFKDLVEDTHNFIKDFDEGIDYGEGVDFLTDKTKDLVELIDNFEYGNERTMNLYEMLFGKDYMEEWDKGDEWIRGRVNQLKTWLENDAYNFFSDEKITAGLGIKDLGNNKLEWNITDKYEDISQMVQDVAQVAQISEDAAKMLIEAFASHGDSDFVKSLQQLSENSAINAIVDQYLGKDGVRKLYWSESELNAVADSLGISFEELKSKIEAKAGAVFSDTVYDVLTGDDLFAQFKESLALNGKDFSSFVNNFIEDRQLDETRLRSALQQFGYSGDMLTDIANTIKESLIASGDIKDGTGIDLGDIAAGIKDVVVNTIEGIVEVAEPVVDKVKNAISEKVNSEDIEVEVDKATVVVDDVAVKLKEFSEGGNVDLTLRPTIPASVLNEAGYEAGEGVATVFTHTFSNEAGNIAINFTPIMADSEGNFIGVLSPESLQTYGENVIAGVHDDVLNLQIGAEFSGDDAIAQAEAAAEQIHELQAEFYVDADTSEAESNIENLSNDVEGLYNLIVTYSGQTFTLYAPTTNVNLLYRAIDNLMVKIRDAQLLASQGINLSVTTTTSGATGSQAKGGQNLKPEIALTGEEAPEIVWNKEKGYAYITGKNGPEFRLLNAGDRVFSGEETKKILKRSTGIKGIVPSYDTGRWGDGDGSGAGGDKAAEEWKNELDRLYNLLQDIAEEQRKQTKLSEEYELLLKNPKSTSQDLIDNIALQLRSYNTEYAQQAKRFVERERDIEEYLKEKVDFKDYVWYNKSNEAEGINSVEIDWTRINNELKETDKDTYDKVVEIINHLEEIEKDRDEAEDAMLKLEAKIAELQDIWRDTFVDFQKRVLDAIVYEQQKIIDNFSDLSSTLSNTASSILQSLQDEINLQRQIRDNTKTEEDINEKEARLAYLRRDTTGKNAQEIMSLEKDISESRQNYSDSLVDQAIGRLSDTNDKAAEQRQHQIEIMQAQLDYDKETGAFNERIESLIQSGIDAEGNLVQGSELETLLKNAEGWDGLTTAQQDKWAGDLNTTTKEVAAFLQKENYETVLGETLAKQLNDSGNMVFQIKDAINNLKGDYDGALSSIKEAIENVANAIEAIPQYQTAASYTSGDKSGGSGGGGGNFGGLAGSSKYKITDPNGATLKDGFLDTTSATDELNKQRQKMIDNYNALYKDVMSKPGASTDDYLDLAEMEKTMNRWKYAKIVPYKTGGLNTKTGPAWLDGTKSRPEYVLNADQTEAFLKLAEVLPQLLRSPTQTAGTKVAGDIYLDLVMNVDEIANDYDVDRIADRVKEIIYDASTYRNVNVINFIK